MTTSEPEEVEKEVRTAKEIYDEKIALSKIGNDFPEYLQNVCINSEIYKEHFYGPKQKGHSAWRTGKECKSGIAKEKLPYCDFCVELKYMRNPRDVV